MLSTLVTNDVRQTLDQFRRSVDQMFDNFYGQSIPSPSNASSERSWTFSPVIESGWNDNYLNVRVVLPGVSDKDVSMTVQDNRLVIEGEAKITEGLEKIALTRLAYDQFHTALTLSCGLDLDHVNGRVSNGVLDIQVPIVEASKPKQLQYQTGEH